MYSFIQIVIQIVAVVIQSPADVDVDSPMASVAAASFVVVAS